MCSISGVIQLNNSGQQDVRLKTVVGRINDALRHRGPDDRGVVEVNAPASASAPSGFQLVLGNTRLAIIDTSVAGHQPMSDPETGNWISYNGETYNFHQLRQEIGNEFGPWRSNSDTEVVLRAYRKWGIRAFAKLRGMFAVAVWDNQKRQLVLARDAFGIKPLYYYVEPTSKHESNLSRTNSGPTQIESRFEIPSGKLVFASEVRALLASGLVPRTLNPAALCSYFEYGSVQAPSTIIENVWSVMPGACVTISQGSKTALSATVSNFSLNKSAEIPQFSSRSEAKTALRSILEDSVRQHLVSDVPLGVFLSGGMDSSALVALMSEVSADPPKTFSVVFDENKFNEANHSRAIAEKFKTEHHEIKLSDTCLLGTLPEALTAIDQPTMDGINTFVVSKAVKAAGVTVALSGLGGDELFGGYPSFYRALRLNSTSNISKRALHSVARVGNLFGRGSIQASKFVQLASSNVAPQDVYRITRQLFSPKTVRQLCGADFTVNGNQTNGVNDHKSDVVNVISRLELDGYMANTLLRDTDSMSMAHSLEVRVPFVDKDVVDFVLSLPGEWKVGRSFGGVPKPLLAETLTDLLPSDFLARPKMGFALPFEKWLGTQLREEISSVLENRERLGRVGIHPAPATRIWSSFLRRPKAVGWTRPWSIYVLTRWCEVNNVLAR